MCAYVHTYVRSNADAHSGSWQKISKADASENFKKTAGL